MAPVRNTSQRRIIETHLENSAYPILPKELHELAQQEAPSLGIATVFRALKDLVNAGKAKVVYIPGDSPRYETAHKHHHHHFKCAKCDQVYDLKGCPGNFESLLPPGFKLQEHEITLFGECANCADK